MPRDDRRPSRLWFWGFPGLANFYLACIEVSITVFPAAFWSLKPEVVPDLLLFPGNLFNGWFVGPMRDALGYDPLASGRLDVLLVLGLWELMAFGGGLVCYGAAALIYAIVRGSGEGADDGKR